MAYIGTQPKDVRSFGKAKFDFTATQGQTAFTGADDDNKTLGFTDGQINVYVNGILMDDSDYSTSGSNTVTLSAAANANDVISVVALQTDIPNSDYVPATGGTFSGDVAFTGEFTSQGIDDNATSTAMTLDSSGNLLVGKTSTASMGSDTAGHTLYSGGTARHIVDGGEVMNVGRLNSNGSIVGFYRDGSAVGNIGVTSATHLHVGSGDTGLLYQGGADAIEPWNISTNGPRHGAIDLGLTSNRFKDVLLDGKVDLSKHGYDPVNTIQAANHPTAAYAATDGSHDHWIELKSKGGTHVVLNSDGSRTSGRTYMDHFTVWQKDRDNTNGRMAFSVDNFGQAHFGAAGVGIDRGWDGYPSISVWRSSQNGDNNTSKNEFRVHGIGYNADSWWGGSGGGDFSMNFRIDGGTYYSSDRRKKTNIESVTNALDTVMQLDGKRFQIVNSEGEVQSGLSKSEYKYGFIAQDIEDIIPDAVKYYADEDDGTENYNNSYSVDYGSVVALLTNAIKELKEENDAMRARLDALEAN